MKRLLLLTFVFISTPRFVCAQVANPSAFTFVEIDQNTVIPPGTTNAGQPTLTSYQVSLFAASADVSTGVPIAVGPVINKNVAVVQPAPAPANTYKITFTQAGITIPPCTVLPCTQYTLLIVAIGPNGTSAKAALSESDPFTATLPVVGQPPAAPTNVKVAP